MSNQVIIGFLIPEFPTQTHCAWWRVGNAMRSHGVTMQMLSTRRPDGTSGCHDFLVNESKNTHYCWPPNWLAILMTWVTRPSALVRGIRYLAGLEESNFIEKLRLTPLLASATDLLVFSQERGIDTIFVHSCANAAHLVAICHEMGGPRYVLRLGGDLDVYGKDHASKMQNAEFIASSAPAYTPDLLKRAKVPEDHIMWTWAGVDLDKYSPGDRSWARHSPSELLVITVARLNRTKGHEDVFAAMAALAKRNLRIRYTLIGAGPYEAALKTRARELGLAESVHFLGAKGADEVIEQLRTADVAILASYAKGEATPAFVCEAMACGLPVIATRIGATTEMVTHGVDGFLVPQRDPGAIAQSLQQLYENEAMREEMAHAASERARDFDCHDVAQRILNRLGVCG